MTAILPALERAAHRPDRFTKSQRQNICALQVLAMAGFDATLAASSVAVVVAMEAANRDAGCKVWPTSPDDDVHRP